MNFSMGSRIFTAIRAFAIHFALSLLMASIVAVLVFGVWFPYPLRELSGGLELFWIIVVIDVICGPLLTALVFDLRKSRRELSLDLTVVVVIQLGALIYGLYSIAQARPVALVFETDRFVAVSAAQVDIEGLANAPPQWRALSWSGPVLLGARSARDGLETLMSIELSLRGLEPSARPAWWQSYDESRPSARQRMKPLVALRARQDPHAQAAIDAAIQKTGISLQKIYYLPLVGRKSLDQWITLLDEDARVIGYAPVGGFE